MGCSLAAGSKLFRTKRVYLTLRLFCDKNVLVKTLDELTAAKQKPTNREMPEPPTTCCMSGCPNCVWLEYAEKLSEYFKDGGEKAMKELDEKITDDNIKAFIMHEWRMRQKKE